MKRHQTTPTATSLPQAPEEEAASRLKRYALTMGIRTTCFVLMAVVTPYGWYTWVFAAGAIFLPYVAVVMANAGGAATSTAAPESPAIAIAAPTSDAHESTPEPPTVIRMSETATPAACLTPPGDHRQQEDA